MESRFRDAVRYGLSGRAFSIHELIDFVLNQKIQVTAHPLGFLCAKLMTLDNACLRLHIWPVSDEMQQDSALTVHDHIFDMESFVLHGAIRNTEYAVAAESVGDFSLFVVKYQGDGSSLEETGQQVRVEISSRNIINAGQIYKVPAGTFHESERCGTGGAATLMVARSTSRSAPFVVGPKNNMRSTHYKRHIVSYVYLLDLISSMVGTKVPDSNAICGAGLYS